MRFQDQFSKSVLNSLFTAFCQSKTLLGKACIATETDSWSDDVTRNDIVALAVKSNLKKVLFIVSTDPKYLRRCQPERALKHVLDYSFYPYPIPYYKLLLCQ